jgi:hypothetical protein
MFLVQQAPSLAIGYSHCVDKSCIHSLYPVMTQHVPCQTQLTALQASAGCQQCVFVPTCRDVGVCTGLQQMYSLKVLDASNNALQGTVPNLLSSSLQQLYLDHNQLTGGVPSMYGSSQELRCWSLDHNPGLCGSLPAGARCLDLSGTNIGEL